MPSIDWDKMSSTYEKMSKKAGFNSTETIEQPSPFGMDGETMRPDLNENVEEVHTPTQEEIDAAFEAKLEEDKRIIMERLAQKKKGSNTSSITYPPNEVSVAPKKTKKNRSALEKRIEYLEEAVQLLMKQQMEMLRG